MKNNIKVFSRKTSIKRLIGLSSIIIITVLLITSIVFRIWIKSNIDEICINAMKQFEGDKIEALISVVSSESHSLKERNNAVWALGKLRDKRAIPVLKSLQTDSQCEHSKYLCQREIEKAIENLEGNRIDLITFK